MKTHLARTLGGWRRWLAKHHSSASEVWLIFFKQHTGEVGVSYSDALDEALCFGWIDSLVKRLDDDRYARKFTPRKANSRWSDINRRRYAALKAAGRIRPPGVKRPPTDQGYDPPPARRELSAVLPDYIQRGLRRHPSARKVFDALSPGHRRRYVAWVDSAKRDDTKARRLGEAIRLLTLGQTLGLK